MSYDDQRDDQRSPQNLFVGFGFDNFLAAIVTRRRHMMTQVRFTCGWLYGKRRAHQKIVRAVHATLGRGFFVLLNCHDVSPEYSNQNLKM
jgi:hypothetical protein